MGIGKRLLILIMMSVNIVFALLYVLAWLASFVSPATLLFPAYTSLILPLTIAVNLLFVILWISFKNWNFLLSLLVLVIFFPFVKNTFSTNIFKKIKHHEQEFTVMTYNTYANHMMKKHSKNDPNPVIEYILEQDPDILCIQEYSANFNNQHLTEKDLNTIFAKYPYKHVHFRVNTGWSLFGTATLSKYPIVNQSLVEYESAYNSSICSDIDINGQIIRVFNCHLESNKITENDKDMAYRLKENFATENIKNTTMHFSKKLGDAYIIRSKQADILADSISNSPYPNIVLGDFNDVATSYTYTKVRNKMEDAFINKGFGLGWTFQTRLLRFRIDYLLYDSELTLNKFKLDKKVRHSDHFPLIGTFSF